MGLADIGREGLGGLDHGFIDRQDRGPHQLVASPVVVAGELRACLLRDRNDGDGCSPLRHQPLRHGSVPRVAAPGRHHDRGRSGLAEDGSRATPGVRPDDGPEVGHQMGVCASSGGMFNNYAIVQGVDQIVPVDVYAPGCPPTPETLIHAISTLHGMIENGEILQPARRQRSGRKRPRSRTTDKRAARSCCTDQAVTHVRRIDRYRSRAW